jgi:superoxide reductase
MKFYKCNDCGLILIQEEAPGCCADEWVELQPNTTDASGEKHVPVIETDHRNVTVRVGSAEHPMIDAHYIMWIVLETSHGYQKKDLHPGEKPIAHFALAEDETVRAAYEYCNLHGLWKAE